MNAKLEFGVSKNAEKAKDDTQMQKEIDLLMKMANTGRVFTEMIVSSNSKDEFLENCAKLYDKCKVNNAINEEECE